MRQVNYLKYLYIFALNFYYIDINIQLRGKSCDNINKDKVYFSEKKRKNKKYMELSKEIKNEEKNKENIQQIQNALKEALNINEEVNYFFIIFNIVRE